ncbi:hypothetical protein HZS_6581, partial [Henneguya salminicola]
MLLNSNIRSSNSEFLYYLHESYFDDEINLVKTNNDQSTPETVLEGAIDFGETGNKIWVVTK